jgi:hypothetical protein
VRLAAVLIVLGGCDTTRPCHGRVAIAWAEDGITAGLGGCAPDLAVDRQGRPHVLYGHQAGIVHAVRESDAWVSEFVAVESCSGTLSVAVDIEGTVHVLYPREGGATLVYATSSPDGFQDRFSMPGWAAADLAVDENGSAHIVAGGEMRYATNAYGGWTIEPLASATAFTRPSLASHGEPASTQVVFGSSWNEVEAIMYGWDPTNAWAIEPVEVGPSLRAGAPRLALSRANQPFVAYLSDGDVSVSSTVTGIEWTASGVTRCVMCCAGPDVVVDDREAVHVVYGESPFGFGCYLRYATTASGFWTIHELGLQGSEPTLALEPSGRLHVVYRADPALLRHAVGSCE